MSFVLYPYRSGMLVELRKPHPCGSRVWRILRVGADARLQCTGCGRQMTLGRRRLEQATRRILEEEADP
ncbi:MAG: DUF951 domain-containing protein [Bacillota bacterium]|nr:DUF951 domain-containing protein [Bacillota bacterium]